MADGTVHRTLAAIIACVLVLGSVVAMSSASLADPILSAGTRVVTQNAAGQLGNNSSQVLFGTPDLGLLFLQSQADNLVPSAQNAQDSVHYYIADTNTQTLAQFDVDAQGIGFASPIQVKTVSKDLRYVLYNRALPNGTHQDELVDRSTGASVTNPCGFEGCGWASAFTLDNGRLIYTVRNLGSYNVAIGDSLLASYNLATRQRTLLATAAMPTFDQIAFNIQPSVGDWIYYSTRNSRLTGDTAGYSHLVRENLVTGQVQVVDVSATGIRGNRDVNDYSVSPDGQFVAFNTLATNLAPGDADGQWRPYLKNITTGALSPLARTGSGPNFVTTVGNFTFGLGSFTLDNSLLICTQDRFLVPQGAGAILRKPDGSLHWFGAACPRGISADGRTQVYLSSPGPDETNYQGQQVVLAPVVLADEQPPVATIYGPSEGASYEFGSVPPATCRIADRTDGTVLVPVSITSPTGPRAQARLGVVVVTCSYVNSIGLSASARTSFTIVDTTPPLLSTPGVFTAEATGPGTPGNYSLVSFDRVDGVRPYVCDRPAGTAFPVGTTTVNCTTADIAGNSSGASFLVRVVDTTPPAISPHDAVAVGASGLLTPVFFDSPTAVDLVDGAVPVTCEPLSGALFPLGTTTVACTATDAHGWSFTSTFPVTVQDRGAPIVNVPGSIAAEATSALGAAVDYGAVTATDDVDTGLVPSCDLSSGVTFPLGETTVTCSAADSAGNVGSAGFIVTVVDTTSPTLNLPPTVVVEASGPIGTIAVYPQPTANDLVDGLVSVSCSDQSGSIFGFGSNAVVCESTDDAGNTALGTFTVRVQDTTQPSLTMPDSVVAEATSLAGALVNYGATAAVDTVSGPLTPTCSLSSGGQFPVGTTQVTCMVQDTTGNTASGAFTVTVIDTTPPALSVPADQSVRATSANGALVTFAPPTAVDSVDGFLQPLCDRQSADQFPVGSTTVSCSAADRAGNTVLASFTVTVRSGGPTIAVPSGLIVEATSAAGAVVAYPSATASDLVEGSLTTRCSPASGSTFPLGTTTVGCSATNSLGQTVSGTFTVGVVDRTAPAIQRATDIFVVGNNSKGRVVNFSTPVASDTVSASVPVTCSPQHGSRFPLGTTAVTCSATDQAGNRSQTSFTVTVRYAWHRTGDLVDGASYRVGQKIKVNVLLTGESSFVQDATITVWAAMGNSDTSSGPIVTTFSTDSQGGNKLRYVPGQGLYSFTIDTKALQPGVWRFTIDTGDGAPRVVTVAILAK